MKTILKIFGGLFLTISLFVGVRFYQYYQFSNTNIGKCVNLYVSMGALKMENDPDIQKKIKEGGHKDIFGLLVEMCKRFDANGQKF